MLARMIGLGLVIEETLTIREHGGRVNEVTWSKVQAAPATIAEIQAYALRQLDALADKLQSKRKLAALQEQLSKPRRRRRSGSPSWLAAGSCRTRSPCWSSTGCSMRRRTTWTGTAWA